MSEVVSVAPARRARVSRWTLLVAASAALLAAAAAALAALWFTTKTSASVTSPVPRNVLGIELRVESGDVSVVGGGRAPLAITHVDHGVYNQAPTEQRSLRKGILRLTAGCPSLVVGSCASDYRLELPDNVPISIRAEHGTVRLDGYRGSADIATNSGSIRVDGYCGFVLGAASATGDVRVAATCSPQRLALRSDSGDVAAVVPSGNYRVDAVSGAGAATVTGVTRDAGAPWSIQALSNTGSVRVTGG